MLVDIVCGGREERREIDRRVRETAGMLGIENLLGRRPNALSGGQLQRVALGRAIVRKPQVFLFDEPLSNLDAKLRIEMRAELKRLHRKIQTTTVYVTHDQEEAMTLGDRVVVMKDGDIQQIGTPHEVYHQPVNRFVAGFFGTPPMNFIEGRVVCEDAQSFFEDGMHRFAISESQRSTLTSRMNRDVVMGVRPDALSLSRDGRASEGKVPAKIEVIEPLGDRMDVHVMLGNQKRLVCRTESRSDLREGQDVSVEVRMDRVLFFENDEAGRNLLVVQGR